MPVPWDPESRAVNVFRVKLWGLTSVSFKIQDVSITVVTSFSSVQFSRSVVSDSLRPHELQLARPPCPSPTPGVHSDSRPSSQWCHYTGTKGEPHVSTMTFKWRTFRKLTEMSLEPFYEARNLSIRKTWLPADWLETTQSVPKFEIPLTP